MTTITPRHPRSRRRAAVLVVVLVLVVLAGLLGLGGLLAQQTLERRYDSRIERFDDPTAAIPEASRPPETTDGGDTGAQDYLLLGSDSRISAGDASQWEVGGQRTDAIMLVHLPADRSGVYVMSIPRDSWVEVPGYGTTKINAAYSYGGPALLVQTVEQLTGVRVDHVAVVDFEGFRQMTDALGGVEITVPETTGDTRETFAAGTQVMDGGTALNYVRQRYNLPGGDFDRVKRQQNWIKAVLRGALSRDTLTSPVRLDRFLRATTSAVSLDDGLDVGRLQRLAFQVRGIRGEDLHFFTVPVAGTGRSDDGQSIVLIDEPEADVLWQAIRDDDLDGWLTLGQADLLGDSVD